MKTPLVTKHYRRLLALTLALGLAALFALPRTNVSHAAGASKKDGAGALADKLSPDLREKLRAKHGAEDRVEVVLTLDGEEGGQLRAFLNRNGVHVKGRFENLGSVAVELPLAAVEELAAFHAEVASVSLDHEVAAAGHVSLTTGATAVRNQVNAKGKTYTLDGTGVTIAVVDSGIDTTHKSFNASGKVTFSRDFTGEGTTGDPYGHGTHVAAIAAGLSSPTSGRYEGVAYNANIVNLRVLNRQGVGKVSNVLAALDWLLANRAAYNVRVVNLSLGAPAVQSYKTDPLCVAVRKLVDAGVVVVAAAGNDGKTAAGQKAYGLIHSPGDEPSAVTVGSSNTFGTDSRADDIVTTYSSRGPTRGYYTDASGVRHYDNLVKPDLVAPGNKINSAEAIGNSLAASYPLDSKVYLTDNQKMMYLSGTSMATPVVAGAAALLLQANPKLTPNMVKLVLAYTAQPLAGFNQLEQGAGQLNVEGAVRLAKLIRTDLSAATPLGAPLLNGAAPDPKSTVGGTTFDWSQAVGFGRAYARGTDLITKYQKVYGLGMLYDDGIMYGDGIVLGDGILLGDSIVLGDGILLGDSRPWQNQAVFLPSGMLLGDGILLGDAILLGDGILLGDSTLYGDGILLGDSTVNPMSVLVNGDNTTCMK
ncbi:MAG TPA: S8 family serine peptidase [Pyrinomonadaceae bacterium]|nr:S8 family serine peptidase [Pyrinomonadaceae bacterium]